MKAIFKKLLCITLVMVSFASVCMVGATETSDQAYTEPTIGSQGDLDTSPRSSVIAVDEPISNYDIYWYQQEGYPSYRLWVDNTTGALMTVTITKPSGQTKNVYITAGNNTTYTDNDAKSGFYKLSFHTYAATLSGTVRVRVSTTPLI